MAQVSYTNKTTQNTPQNEEDNEGRVFSFLKVYFILISTYLVSHIFNVFISQLG